MATCGGCHGRTHRAQPPARAYLPNARKVVGGDQTRGHDDVLGPNQHETIEGLEIESGDYELTLVSTDGRRGNIKVKVDPETEARYAVDFSGEKPTVRRLK